MEATRGLVRAVLVILALDDQAATSAYSSAGGPPPALRGGGLLALRLGSGLPLPLLDEPIALPRRPARDLLLNKEEQLALVDLVPREILPTRREALGRALGLPLPLLRSIVPRRVRWPVGEVVL
ncbi:hypothetical protein BGZ57DRAFT_1000725 [Hyaloscypha finlandica]|nr:hypothetical protein BGZ57DRAFT_1000725 [Hyaloscypha finlandica]